MLYSDFKDQVLREFRRLTFNGISVNVGAEPWTKAWNGVRTPVLDQIELLKPAVMAEIELELDL